MRIVKSIVASAIAASMVMASSEVVAAPSQSAASKSAASKLKLIRSAPFRAKAGRLFATTGDTLIIIEGIGGAATIAAAVAVATSKSSPPASP